MKSATPATPPATHTSSTATTPVSNDRRVSRSAEALTSPAVSLATPTTSRCATAASSASAMGRAAPASSPRDKSARTATRTATARKISSVATTLGTDLVAGTRCKHFQRRKRPWNVQDFILSYSTVAPSNWRTCRFFGEDLPAVEASVRRLRMTFCATRPSLWRWGLVFPSRGPRLSI